MADSHLQLLGRLITEELKTELTDSVFICPYLKTLSKLAR
jgi:hypothetical protein